MNRTLGGIYNPQEMPETEFLARYSVRLELTQRLLRDILASGPKQDPTHIVIQGQRGQGKTTLLRRLYLALRDNPDSNPWLIPVRFKEELYCVTNLCRLWEETARLLDNHPAFTELGDRFEAAWKSAHYEQDCYLLLDQALQKAGIRLVLLIDNLGDLFTKLNRREQQRLREILHTTRRIQIVGASSSMLEQHYDHGAPFYQFFRQINLAGLNLEESLTLLRHLGTPEQQERLEQVITESTARIETLRRLTAGVPRTLVLLFEILLDPDGSAFHDLELLLDRVTPLYKHRMDDLPPQQQAIVDAVALGWDAVSTRELAKTTRLPGKQVSAQLKQLERANIVHKEPTSTKNHLYRLEERFFNIWYLMRHGRPGDHRRALWLVRFLEFWCTPIELAERTERHLKMLENGQLQPEHAAFMTEALLGAGLDPKMMLPLFEATLDYLPETMRKDFRHAAKMQIELSNETLKKKARSIQSTGRKIEQLLESLETDDYQSALSLFEQIDYVENPELMCIAASLYQKIDRHADAARWYKKAAEKGDADAMLELALLYHQHLNRYDEALHWLREAAQKGHATARIQLALWNFERSDHSETALSGLLESLPEPGKPDAESSVLVLAIMLLWKQEFRAAFAVLKRVLPSLDLEQYSQPVSIALLFLLATGQTAYMARLFEAEEFSVYRFRDRFKPFYYALLTALGQSRADDLKRMGPELADTVKEINERATSLQSEYFSDS